MLSKRSASCGVPKYASGRTMCRVLAVGQVLGALPVLRLGGKLVNGDAGPRVQRDPGGGQ